MTHDELHAIANRLYRAEGQHFTLTEAFKTLCKPVKRRVPLHICEQWHEDMLAISNETWVPDKVDEAGTSATKDELLVVFRNFCAAVTCSNLPQPLQPWTQAVLILTAYTFSGSLNEFLDHTCEHFLLGDENDNAYEVLAKDLQRLYSEDAKKELAGPLGFYCLAKTTLLLPILRDVYDYILRQPNPVFSYFYWFKNFLDGGTQFPLLTDFRKDRCYAFLDRIVRSSDEVPENHGIHAVDLVGRLDRFKLSIGIRKRGKYSHRLLASYHKMTKTVPEDPNNPAPPRRVSASDEKEKIRILLIGDTASGKTTIIDQLHQAVKQHVRFGEVILSPSENIEEIRRRSKEGAKFPHQSTQDMVVYEGKARLHGRNHDFQIIDSRGGLLETPPPSPNTDIEDWPVLYREAVKANLVILVIPADYFDLGEYNERMLGFLKNYVLNLPDYKPQSMVAVVYSKCDEFGVTMKGSYRVIETPQDRTAFETFRQTPGDNAKENWERFLEEVAGHQNIKDDVVQLRRYLLNETRELWETISSKQALNHKFINGYFVAAQPIPLKKNEIASNGGLRRDTPINWTARGFPLLLADFFYHIEHMKGPL